MLFYSSPIPRHFVSKNAPCSVSSNWKRVLEPVVQEPDRHVATRWCQCCHCVVYVLPLNSNMDVVALLFGRSLVLQSCCWYDDRIVAVYDGFPKVFLFPSAHESGVLFVRSLMFPLRRPACICCLWLVTCRVKRQWLWCFFVLSHAAARSTQ